MKISVLLASAAILAGSLAASVPAQAAGHKCVRSSATAAMIGSPIAAEMAKLSLATAISTSGRKGKGRVSVKCKYEFVISVCTASQKAC